MPDFRGEFLRGYDAGRGVDLGRTVGSSQGEDVGTHTHEVYLSGSGTANNNVNRAAASENFHTATIDRTGPGGGDETRPRNIAVRYLIRAAQ